MTSTLSTLYFFQQLGMGEREREREGTNRDSVNDARSGRILKYSGKRRAERPQNGSVSLARVRVGTEQVTEERLEGVYLGPKLCILLVNLFV